MAKIINLIGEQFTFLTVIKRIRNDKGDPLWQCKCRCGNITNIETAKLKNGHTRSCGCLKRQKEYFKNKVGRPYTHSVTDYIGQNFGDWKVIKFSHQHKKSRNQYWFCKCLCGVNKPVKLSSLLSGESTCCTTCSLSKRGENARRWSGYQNIPKGFFNKIMNGAAARDIVFELTIEQVNELFLSQNKCCVYSGSPLKFSHNRGGETTASLDRIDSKGGYTIDNIHFIHKDINFMKLDLSENEFLNFVKLIHHHMQL